MDTLDKLEALEKAATKGPWPLEKSGDGKRIFIAPNGNSWGTDVGEVYSDDADSDEAMASAQLIVAMRNALPDLIAVARCAAAMNRAAIESYKRMTGGIADVLYFTVPVSMFQELDTTLSKLRKP